MPATISSFPIEGRNPEETPITRNTIISSDKFVIQNGSVPKVISMGEAIKLFAPLVNNSPLDYTPSVSGNTANLNEYVIGQNGKKYFIDAYGNATERGIESRGRYASLDDAVNIGLLVDGERFTLDNINHPLHGGIIEVII